MSSNLVCVGCHRTEGHTEGCDLGGYITREQLAAERDAEWAHDRDHLLTRVPGCEFC